MNLDIPKVGDLQVAQDLAFQKRSWTLQRVGWVAMLAVIAAAVAGFFGGGPVADGEVVGEDGAFRVLHSEYPRKRAPETLLVRVADDAVDGDEVRVGISRDFLRGIEIESIKPEPDRVETGPEETVFVFALTDDGVPAEIAFTVTYDDIGAKQGFVRVVGHPPVRISQFVYP